jgi:hypothetical protein
MGIYENSDVNKKSSFMENVPLLHPDAYCSDIKLMSLRESMVPSLHLTALQSSSSGVKTFENLMLVTDSSSKPYLLGIDSDSQVSKICSGVSSQILGRLEGPSKAQSVWVSSNLPSCLIVSFLGSTSVLCLQDGVFTELDQSQTKLILSETTISVCDLREGMVVQASRYWVNICSPRTSCMYRSSHGERVICASSSIHYPEVAVALSDGDLVRGRSKVVILQISESSGMVIEKHRREYSHEILELVTIPDGSIVAITADKSILFLSSTLSILTNLAIDFPLKSIALFGNSDILVSTSTGVLLSFNPTTRELTNSTMLSQRPVSFGRSDSAIFAFSSQRYFVFTDDRRSPQRLHPPNSEEFHSLASLGTVVAGVSMLGDVVIFESNVFDHSDLDIERVQIQNLPTKLSGHMIKISNGCLFLGGPTGYPTFVSTTNVSRSFPMMEGTVCGALISPDLMVTYSIHEKSLVLFKLIISDQSLDIIRLLAKPVCSQTDTLVSCIECFDSNGTVILAFENGDIQTWKISEESLPILTRSITQNFPPGSCWVLPLSMDEFVLVHSLVGVFTLTNDLEFTSVSPSFVEDSPLASSITCACVVDQQHVMTGDVWGVVSLYRIPGMPRIGSRLEKCMQVTDISTSVRASSDRINKLVHCRDSRKIIYYTANDVSVGVISSDNFPLNWYWD